MQLTANADNTFAWGTATSAFSIDTANAFLIFPNDTSSTQRVGIGTSTPNSKLHVNGTVTATAFSGNGANVSNVTAAAVVANGVTSGMIATDAVGSAAIASGAVGTDEIANNTITGSDLATNINIPTTGTIIAGSSTVSTLTTTGSATVGSNFVVGTGTLFVNTTNNRVGIGTTAPGANLEVNNAGDVSIYLSDSGAPKWNIKNTASTDRFSIGSGSIADILNIEQTGNVGIGTTTPSTELHVIGTVTVSGNLGIGMASPADKLDVNGRIISTNVANANNRHLTFSGYTGNSWDLYGGHGGGGYFGISENAGTPAFVVQATSGNVGIGTTTPSSALHVVGTVTIFGNNIVTDTDNNTNTYVGIGTGNALVGTGTNNTAFGNSALGNNTTGSWNTASGYQTLYSNITGEDNTANGFQSLFSNVTGNSNTANGHYALRFNTSGSKNTSIGKESGHNTLGSGNIFLGFQAGYNETGTNTLYIANSASNTLIYGDFGSNRVGIYTTTPARTLSVNGDAGGTGAWFNDSDERLKENIIPIESALAKVTELQGVQFERKDITNREKGKRIGFIAQQAKEIIPEVVDKKGEYYSMQYAPITALLVEAIKELKMENDALWSELKEENDALKTENDVLKKRLAELEKSVWDIVGAEDFQPERNKNNVGVQDFEPLSLPR